MQMQYDVNYKVDLPFSNFPITSAINLWFIITTLADIEEKFRQT